jgi:hypothetical protein
VLQGCGSLQVAMAQAKLAVMTYTPQSVEIYLALLVVCFGSIALADDFTTINGKEYKSVTVTRVEPDGIVLKTTSGNLENLFY